VHDKGMVIAGPSRFGERFMNSVIIGFGSTFLSVFLGTLAAYAFSRFRVPLKDDLMFFILSTRMMPPIAVAIPIFLMFRNLGLSDTHLGMILLYTAVNLSLAVWLLKGFIDEIPREYEEAALIDGYTRFQAFTEGRAAAGGDRHRLDRDLLPDLRLERIRLRGAADLGHGADRAALHPHDHRRGRAGLAGGRGGATIFLVPVMVFTILLRKHLLRGITFGAVRK
jgi:multiple sugar transport system permease protein